MRGFEAVSSAELRTDLECLKIPSRKTSHSAGYDFACPHEITIKAGQSVLIYTGIKAFMLPDEYLSLHIRSSKGIKQGLMLKNCTGIIDSDYCNNYDNEGEIIACVQNTSDKDVTLAAGEEFMQGIFCKYLTTYNDCTDAKRLGGIGSTDK